MKTRNPQEPSDPDACRAAVLARDPATNGRFYDPALAELAARAGMSPFHFHRIFKSVTGLTPTAYGAARLRNELERTPA